MDFLRSSARNFPSYEPQPVEVSVPNEEKSCFQKIINGCFTVLFSPIWIAFSVIVEMLCIPFHLTYNIMRRCQDKLSLLVAITIVSPLILLSLIIVGTVLMPVSFIMKVYEFILTDDFTEAMKSLIYPNVHPVYENYLQPLKKTRKAKVAQSFEGLRTATSSYVAPCGVEPEGLVTWKDDEEMKN